MPVLFDNSKEPRKIKLLSHIHSTFNSENYRDPQRLFIHEFSEWYGDYFRAIRNPSQPLKSEPSSYWYTSISNHPYISIIAACVITGAILSVPPLAMTSLASAGFSYAAAQCLNTTMLFNTFSILAASPIAGNMAAGALIGGTIDAIIGISSMVKSYCNPSVIVSGAAAEARR